MKKKNNLKKNDIEIMEIKISNLLRVGVIISAVFILVGLIMFLITGNSGYSGSSFPHSIGMIFNGLIALNSYGIILTGLLLLILTPVFRVGISIIIFFQEKDYLYMVITSIVLIILIISFLLGKIS